MFRGINAITIDVKGRMVMPTRYREQLQLEGGSVILTIDIDAQCLLIYPLAEWEIIESKLIELPSFNPATRRIQRLLLGHAMEADIDALGRILIPPLLRDYANLRKRAVLMGQGKKFELWDKTDWEQSRVKWLQEESEADASMLPDHLKTISL